MSGEPRKHHYVSAFYLANFTREGARHAKLHVIDFEKREQRKSSPHKEGLAKDHFRVDGEEPFALETIFGKEVEAPVKPVIAEIVQEQRMPEAPRDYGLLMAFLAHLKARVRSRRLERKQYTEEGMRYLSALAKRGKPYFVERLTAEDDPDPEQAWSALQELKSRPGGMTRNDIVMTELDVMRAVGKMLRRRKWRVVSSSDPAFEFATCDDPVMMIGGSANGLVGFDVPDTAVVVPIHRTTAIMGTLRSDDVEIEGSRFAAVANQYVLRRAHRFVWSARPRFAFDWSNGQRLRDPTRAFKDRTARDQRGEGESRADLPPTDLATAEMRRRALELERDDDE